jgi:hypothetical protein
MVEEIFAYVLIGKVAPAAARGEDGGTIGGLWARETH